MYLHLLWCLDLDVSRGIAVHLLKQLVELFVGHNHLHLLLGSSVSMTNDAYHTAQLVPGPYSVYIYIYIYICRRCECG